RVRHPQKRQARFGSPHRYVSKMLASDRSRSEPGVVRYVDEYARARSRHFASDVRKDRLEAYESSESRPFHADQRVLLRRSEISRQSRNPIDERQIVSIRYIFSERQKMNFIIPTYLFSTWPDRYDAVVIFVCARARGCVKEQVDAVCAREASE